jgi:hypothetical protein
MVMSFLFYIYLKWQAMQLGMHGFGEVYATSISGGGVVRGKSLNIKTYG